MASTAARLISEEEYLHTSYRPDCDFVDGVVVERELGKFGHSRLQSLLTAIFITNEAEWGVLGMVEQRLRIRPRKYRVPDLLALPLNYDSSQEVVTVAPLLCIEILSPEDRMPRVLERCWDYSALGVPETWIFDPQTKQVFIARDMVVTQFMDDMLRCGKIQISCSALFSRLS